MGTENFDFDDISDESLGTNEERKEGYITEQYASNINYKTNNSLMPLSRYLEKDILIAESMGASKDIWRNSPVR